MKTPGPQIAPPAPRHPVALLLCLLVLPLLMVTGCASYPQIGPDWKWQQFDQSAQRPTPRTIPPTANSLIASVNPSVASPSALRPAK